MYVKLINIDGKFLSLMRILLAESNELIGTLIQSILEKTGHHTYLARDGIEAFRMLNLEHYDLVITEILLPYYTGLEVLHFINNQEHKPKTIVLSSVQNLDTVYKAYQLNADSYLTKPFNPDRLPQEIEKLDFELADQLDIDSSIIVNEQHLNEEAIQKILKISRYLIHRIPMPELGLFQSLTDNDLWFKLVLIFCMANGEELPRHLKDNEFEYNKFKYSLSLDVLIDKKKEAERYIAKILDDFHVTSFPDRQAGKINELLNNSMVVDKRSFVLLEGIEPTLMAAQEIRNLLIYRAPSFNFRTASEYMVETGLSVDVIGLDFNAVNVLQKHLRMKIADHKFENNREIYESVEQNLRDACAQIGIPLAYFHRMLDFTRKDTISFILNDLFQ